MDHELKTWPEFFDAVRDGRKNFEVRKNDRGFQAGDFLVLRKWDPTSCAYMDDEPIRRRVAYVLSGFGIEPGYVVMGLGAGRALMRARAKRTADGAALGEPEEPTE